ncbi:hypothetical protein [Nannocystis radixulma]|uniref:Uncharacterized protein n=1 Tax=Nannocystis radixulma TaxID=2995305 RepID=A0ABT5BSM8_9BACT|nr:hypothetical protein [Nannocystis radixulma]MDC0675982.1 hypothetical protein [Nannocystis radixulma]
MERDKHDIGLTEAAELVLNELVDKGWFNERQDAARFCLAYAVRAKIPEGVTERAQTRWSAGNFDSTGEIRALLAALYPSCRTPVRLMEHLIHEGLRLLSARLKSDSVGPGDLMD